MHAQIRYIKKTPHHTQISGSLRPEKAKIERSNYEVGGNPVVYKQFLLLLQHTVWSKSIQYGFRASGPGKPR